MQSNETSGVGSGLIIDRVKCWAIFNECFSVYLLLCVKWLLPIQMSITKEIYSSNDRHRNATKDYFLKCGWGKNCFHLNSQKLVKLQSLK